MPRCGCRSPTTGGPAARSCCPIRMRRPASRCRAKRSQRCSAEHPDQLVVVDEAYVDFGGESAVPLVARHDNLLVMQTLSKSRALAGLRVGFAIGQRPLIEALERVKDSFNSYPLDCLAHGRRDRGDRGRGLVPGDPRAHHREPRGRWSASLPGLGFEVLPSQANFVFARHPGHRGADLAAGAARSAACWCAISQAADRGLPAHHGRHGGRVCPPC